MNKKTTVLYIVSVCVLLLIVGTSVFLFPIICNEKTNKKSSKWDISREYEMCTEGVYEFDEYSTSNQCEAKSTYVVYEDGEKITVEEALKNKKVTSEELSKKGVDIKKVSTSNVTIWSIKREYDECTPVIYELHKDKDYQYTTSNPCEALNTYMVYESGEKYTIEEALKSGRVTYDV